MNWNEPTDEMMAALLMMRRAAFKGGMSEIQCAEWVMTAKDSLWYMQAKRWVEHPPNGVEHRSREFFSQGCALIVEVVDLGYDEERREWWPLKKLWPTDSDFAGPLLLLMDLGFMLKRLPNVGQVVKGTTVFPVVSAGFQVFISLICGPRWERRYEAMVTAMAQARRFSRPRPMGR